MTVRLTYVVKTGQQIARRFHVRDLTFIGPVYTATILSKCPSHSKLWISLGLFNVVVVFPGARNGAAFNALLSKQQLAYEQWDIHEGRISRIRNSPTVPVKGAWR